MRTRQPPSRVRLRWRCGWMFLSVPQTYPSPQLLDRVSSLVYPCFGIEEIGDWALGAVFRRLVTFPPRAFPFGDGFPILDLPSCMPLSWGVRRRDDSGGLSCSSSEAVAHRRCFPPPGAPKKRASLPSRGGWSSLRRSGSKLITLNQRQKEAAPKGGGFRWICVLGVGLEEDDAADLEQIPIVEALAYVLLAEGDAAIVRCKVSVMPVRSRSISWCCHRA